MEFWYSVWSYNRPVFKILDFCFSSCFILKPLSLCVYLLLYFLSLSGLPSPAGMCHTWVQVSLSPWCLQSPRLCPSLSVISSCPSCWRGAGWFDSLVGFPRVSVLLPVWPFVVSGVWLLDFPSTSWLPFHLPTEPVSPVFGELIPHFISAFAVVSTRKHRTPDPLSVH